MANPITSYIARRFVKPEVDRETSRLKKELNKAKNRVEEKDFDLLTTIGGRFGINTRTQQRRILDHYVSWAYANISVIAERVADIELELYQLKSKDNVEELDAHPALDLLLRVNDFQTKWDLVFTWAHNMLTMGEAAWYLVGRNTPNSEPTEIWPLRPDYLQIIPGNLENNEFVSKYVYKIPGKEEIEFDPWQILFFKNPHPTNAYRGYGVLEAAMTDVHIDLFASSYNENFFENQARPDAVLMTENKLTDEVHARVSAAWASKYGGSNNAGKTAILEQGLKYMQVQPNAKDMDFLEQQKWTRDKLMAIFKNTKVILGITDDVNRANAEASEYVWLKHNIRPKMQRLVDYLNEFLIPMYGDNLILSFRDPLPESTDLKLAEYEKGVDKWLTRNEIRAREGLDPVEGGDVLYVGFAEVPVGTDPLNPADATPKYLTLSIKKGMSAKLNNRFRREIRTLKNRQARFKRMEDAVEKVINDALGTYSKKLLSPIFKNGEVSKDIQKKRWQVFAQRSEIFESKVARVVAAVMNKHKVAVLKRITDNYKPGKSVTKGIDDLVPGDEAFVKASINALTPILSALAQEEGEDTFDFLGLGREFEASKELRKNLNKLVLEGSESYVGTMRERIKAQIIEGVEKGEGVAKLKKRITNEYQLLTAKRASMIARTETIRSANATSQDAFKQSGVVGGKQWFTAPDCNDPECLAFDGKIIEIDDDFAKLGGGGPDIYTNIGYPPLHPNCRCTISPVLISKNTVAPKKKDIMPHKEDDVKRVQEDLKMFDRMKEEIKKELEEDYKKAAKVELREELEDQVAEKIQQLVNKTKNEQA